MQSLTPERHYMRLFKEIVRHVWKQRQAASDDVIRKVTASLVQTRQRKNRTVDLLLDGRIDQQTYDEQVLRLNTESEEAERQLSDANDEHMDVEAVLEFAEQLVERPKETWLESSHEQKQRLQGVFFPDGLTYTSEGFGTATSCSFFNVLRETTEEKASLASPTRFEPVLSPRKSATLR